jgi:hypothetical protein
MRLISYDVGIKNLAYCVIQYGGSEEPQSGEGAKHPTTNSEPRFPQGNGNQQLSILDWNVLNLLEKEAPTEQCSQMIPGKTKKLPPCKCTKLAKYQKNEKYYCERHAKKGCPFLIPTKKHSRPYLKKLKVLELQQLAKSLFLFGENLEKQKRDELIDKIATFYDKQCLEPIIKKKAENAGDADLILIGKRMKQVLNENPITATITDVIIENQISPIATRMKTLQGMLTQYYIDHIENVDITFVSSVHKLKQFQGSPSKDDEKTTYKDHKKSGIEYCNQILEKNAGFSNWISKMDTKKKDDLADCFLQGLWYFKQKGIITYGDDLTIRYKNSA